MPLNHPKLGSLANEFTSTFAMFEYALKQCGFRRMVGQKLESSWDKFAEACPEIASQQFFEQLKANPISAYIINEPPKHRTEVDDGGQKKLGWRAPDAVNDMKALYYAVKRVRNNLFHGDKMEWQATREESLLRSGLAVIDGILAKSPELKSAFIAGSDLFQLQTDL